jgi:hypothetical protein
VNGKATDVLGARSVRNGRPAARDARSARPNPCAAMRARAR